MLLTKKKTLVQDVVSKNINKHLMDEVLDEKAMKLSNAEDLTIESVEALRKKLQDNIKVCKDELLALKKYNLNSFFKMDTPVGDSDWYRKYDDTQTKKIYYNTSKYFHEGENMDTVLDKLRVKEIKRDQFDRTGRDDKTVSILMIAWLNFITINRYTRRKEYW